MENLKAVEKLKNKTNISYEEARIALEEANWDILDAMIYLEKKGEIKKPSVSIYFTNENKKIHEENYRDSHEKAIVSYKGYKGYKKEGSSGGFFTLVCEAIDKCNNIFLEIKRDHLVMLKLPLTVMILLIIFAFWILIPLTIIALLFDIEFSLVGKNIDNSKVNYVFKVISTHVKEIKENFKKGYKR